jgi:hypothetical protein
MERWEMRHQDAPQAPYSMSLLAGDPGCRVDTERKRGPMPWATRADRRRPPGVEAQLAPKKNTSISSDTPRQ